MRSVAWLVLAAVLVLGATLRFVGLGYGLPLMGTRVDEGIITQACETMARSRSLDPRLYNYPGLGIYGYYAVQRLVHAGRGLLGSEGGGRSFADLAAARPDELVWVNRLVAAGLGSLTVLVTFFLGQALGGRAVGLAAAFLLAVAYLPVRESHFGLADTPVTFLVTVALLAAVRAARRATAASLLLGAAVSGLAAAVKYPAALLCVPVAVAHLLASRKRGISLARALHAPRLGLAAAAMVLAFLAAAPYTVLSFGQFLRGFGLEVVHFRGASYPPELAPGWIRNVTFSLRHGLGPILLVACGLALLLAAVRPRRPDTWILVSFVLAFHLGMGYGRTTLVRYVLPLVPPLLVLAALGLERLAGRIPDRRVRAAFRLVALAALAFIPLRRSVAYDRAVIREDTRLVARRWLEDHVAPGELIMVWKDLGRTLSGRRFTGYDPKKLLDGRARYVVVSDFERERWVNLDRILEHGVRAKRVFAIAGLEPGARARAVYDPFEGVFFVPLVGYGGLIRPGPDLEIYRVEPLARPAAPPPEPPTGLEIEVASPDIRLTWTSPRHREGLLAYVVYVYCVGSAVDPDDVDPAMYVPPGRTSLHVPMVPPGRYWLRLASLGLGGETPAAKLGYFEVR